MPLSLFPLDPPSRKDVPLSCKECSELTACEPWPYSSWAAPKQWLYPVKAPVPGLSFPVWYPSRGSFDGEFVSSAVQFVVSPSLFCFIPHSFLQGQFCNTLGRLPLPTLFLPTFIILRPYTPNSISHLFLRGPDALSGICAALPQPSCPILFLFNHIFQQLLNQPYLLLCDSGQVSWNRWLPECSGKKRRKSSPIDPLPTLQRR